MMKLEEKLNEIFDNCYSKDLSTCPKHTIFQRQKALNLILELEPLIRQDERERIAKALEVARKIDWIFVDKEQRVTVKTVMRKEMRRTLDEMLLNSYMPMSTKQRESAKGQFKEWLKQIDLPDHGSPQAIRQLLIVLADEAIVEKKPFPEGFGPIGCGSPE